MDSTVFSEWIQLYPASEFGPRIKILYFENISCLKDLDVPEACIASTNCNTLSLGKNIIPIFEDEKVIRKQVMSIVTDNTPIDKPKNKDTPLFSLFSLFLDESEQKDLEQRYDGSGLRYGDIKMELFEKIMNYFSPFRAKRDQYFSNKKQVIDILQFGAEKANKVADSVLDRVRSATGIGKY